MVNIGIVLIAHVIDLRASGLAREAAILQAGRDRLRPILMTTMTTLLGMMPLAVGDAAVGGGGGGDGPAYYPMARAIIGGLGFSAGISLLVVPMFYVWFDDLRLWAKRVFLGKKDSPNRPYGSVDIAGETARQGLYCRRVSVATTSRLRLPAEIKRHVGRADQRLRRPERCGHAACNAEAGSHRQVARARGHLLVGDRRPQALGHVHRCLGIHFGEHDGKLFTAVSGNQVVSPHARQQSSTDLDEDFVADPVRCVSLTILKWSMSTKRVTMV